MAKPTIRIATVLLAGLAITPLLEAKEKPKVSVEELQKENLKAGSQKNKTGEAVQITSLTLEIAIREALQNNLSFQNAFTDVEIAERARKAADASLFEPSLGFAGNRRGQRYTGGRASIYNADATATYRQTLSNSIAIEAGYQTIFQGGNDAGGAFIGASKALNGKDNQFLQNELNLRLAEEDRQIAYHQFLNSYQDLVYRVVQSYLGTIKNFRQIEVANSVLDYRKELLELTKVKFNLGVSTRLDVLRVEVQVAQQEERIIATQNSYDNSLDDLLNLMNYRQNREMSLDYDSQETFRDYVEKDWQELAKQNRQDLKISNLNAKKESLRLSTSKQLEKNKIMFNGRMSEVPGVQQFPGQVVTESSWNAGVSYTIPLGNEFRKQNTKIQALRVTNQERRSEELAYNVEVEVREAIRNLNSTQKRIKVLKKNVEQAEENLKLAQLSYEKGIKALIEVLDAQDDLLEVKTSFVNSLLDLRQAEYALLKSCGLISVPLEIQELAMREAGIAVAAIME